MRLREILTFQDRAFERMLQPAIEAIESVHQFSRLPPCPVVPSRKRMEQSAYYFRDRPNIPQRIEVSRLADFPNLTLIHEVGHLVDTLMLNSFKSGYGSEVDPRFDNLQAEWAGSLHQMERLLVALSRSGTPRDRHYLGMLMRPRELWARSYMQWVVTRAASDDLKAQLDRVRIHGTFIANRHVILQWDAEAFMGIMREIDRIMNEVCPP